MVQAFVRYCIGVTAAGQLFRIGMEDQDSMSDEWLGGYHTWIILSAARVSGLER